MPASNEATTREVWELAEHAANQASRKLVEVCRAAKPEHFTSTLMVAVAMMSVKARVSEESDAMMQTIVKLVYEMIAEDFRDALKESKAQGAL